MLSKQDIINTLSEEVNLSQKDMAIVVETILSTIVDTLKRGDKVEIRGFGSFRVRHKKAREGRNPKTGEKISIPAKRIPYLKFGKELRGL
jgi:integration host factor subunit beta